MILSVAFTAIRPSGLTLWKSGLVHVSINITVLNQLSGNVSTLAQRFLADGKIQRIKDIVVRAGILFKFLLKSVTLY